MLELLIESKGNNLLMFWKESNFNTMVVCLEMTAKCFSGLFGRKKSVQIQRRNRFVIGRGSIRHWLCVWSSGILHNRSISVLGSMCLLSKDPDESLFFALKAIHFYFPVQCNGN